MADLEGVHVGEFGKSIRLYCKWKGKVQNVAGYSSGDGEIKIKFWSPEPIKRLEVNGGYSSSGGLGGDGIIEFSMTSDKYFDRSGLWEGQVWLEQSTGGNLVKSKKFSVDVGE